MKRVNISIIISIHTVYNDIYLEIIHVLTGKQRYFLFSYNYLACIYEILICLM